MRLHIPPSPMWPIHVKEVTWGSTRPPPPSKVVCTFLRPPETMAVVFPPSRNMSACRTNRRADRVFPLGFRKISNLESGLNYSI